MALKDYYSVLGVAPTADEAAIKKAHRKLARDYHPDRNPDDPSAEERFKEVQEAYDTLGDAKTRRTYDARRSNPFAGTNGQPGSPYDDLFTGSGNRYRANRDGSYVRYDTNGGGGGFDQSPFDDSSDLFSRFFGGGAASARGPRTSPGRDAETSISLSFEEGLNGASKEFTVNGEPIRLTIPKGASNGMKIRVKGRGIAGTDGTRGDLYVTFHVADDSRFRRDGNDLHVTETVDAFEAMLGTSRTLATAYGDRIRITIPPGSQNGDKLRVRGKGVVRSKKTGDLYITVAVETPRLSEQQRDVLREAAKEAGIAVPDA